MMKIARFLVYGGFAFFLISVLLLGIGCVGVIGGTPEGATGTAKTGESLFNFGVIVMVLSILAMFVGVIVAFLGKAVGAHD